MVSIKTKQEPLPETELLPEAEPFFFPASDKQGCLLVHGFTSTPQSMRLMGEALHKKGITSLGVRLKGHGTSVEDMAQSTYRQWIASAEEGLFELSKHCKKIFVSGLSMGGTISLFLSYLHPHLISGVVPVCSPIMVKGGKEFLPGFLKYVVKTMPGLANNIKDPDAREVAYDVVPTAGYHELFKLFRATRKVLPWVKQPALVMAARQDSLVPPYNAEYIYQELGSREKTLVWLENCYHVATLDLEKDLVFDKTAEFIKNYQVSLKG